MAYTELQTAAIRLVHVTRPTDRDLDYLQREFTITPDDAEAVLGVATQSAMVDHPRYRRLSVQWPLAARHGLALTEIHCFVGADWLIVVDHGNFTAAVELMKELQTLPPERLWQDRPMMVLYEVWRRAIRDVGVIDQIVSGPQRQSLITLKLTISETLKNFAVTAPEPEPGMIQGWRWLAFTLSHTNPAAARIPVAISNRLPFTARSYAAASAAVAIATLLVISKTL